MSKHQRASDFVGDLCVALAHRWESERPFMILTAYFDESGTHGDSPLSAMAGFVGDARQWRKFEKRTGKLFARFKVNVFHMVDVRRTHKDFEGWTVDRKIEFLDEFQHIINECLESGVAAFLSAEDYRFYCDLEWPRRARKDSKYCIMFRACMSQILETVFQTPRWADGKEPSLHVVVESGHANAKDIVRLYNFVKERLPSRALSGLTFADKKDCLPLAAADLFAYTAWGKELGVKPIGTAKKPIKAEASFRQNLFRIVLRREELLGLHAQAVEIVNENFSQSGRLS
jgi:hypothetical protein